MSSLRKKRARVELIVVMSLVAIAGIYLFSRAYKMVEIIDSLAGIFFTQSTSVAELQNKYEAARRGGKPVRVMIMPGHEPDGGGTEYRDLIERDLNVTIADYLAIYLRSKRVYEVIVARDISGYNKTVAAFLDVNKQVTAAYVNNQKSIMNALSANGLVDRVNGVFHNAARPEVVARLYGLNLFANSNNVDIVIHVHLNDYERKYTSRPGKYDGFAVYVPERQFSNARASRKLGEAIAAQLSSGYATSSMPLESAGVIEDQDLISVGAYNTLNAAGVLVEYAYIYEPALEYEATRDVVLQDLALKTANGVDNFLRGSSAESGGTALLPYVFTHAVSYETEGSRDILALQSLLKEEGYYPPAGKDLHDCPVSGTFGPCTKSALANFQNARGLKLELGNLGPKTRAELNKLAVQ